jgi:hypothetical protein
MTQSTLMISPYQEANQKATVHVGFYDTAYTVDLAARRRAPFFVPRDQAYFWTLEWQLGEAEALREIAEGNVLRFSSGAAAAEWLLSDAE